MVGDVVEKPAEDLVVAHLVKWTNIGQLILKARNEIQGTYGTE